MADDITVKIHGIEEAIATLRGLPDKLRRRALRNALAAGARIVREAARQAAPVISASAFAVRKGYRKVGTIRDSITVRTSKQARKAGDVGVFVNVRPAKKGKRGSKNPNDPFYWRFLEFGWTPANRSHGRGKAGIRARRKLSRAGAKPDQPGRKFLKAGADVLNAALEAFKAAIGPQLAKLNRNPKDPL